MKPFEEKFLRRKKSKKILKRHAKERLFHGKEKAKLYQKLKEMDVVR